MTSSSNVFPCVFFSATVLSFHDRINGKKYQPAGVGRNRVVEF